MATMACASLIWQAKLQFVPSISLQSGHTALDDARNEGHAIIVEVFKQYSRWLHTHTHLILHAHVHIILVLAVVTDLANIHYVVVLMYHVWCTCKFSDYWFSFLTLFLWWWIKTNITIVHVKWVTCYVQSTCCNQPQLSGWTRNWSWVWECRVAVILPPVCTW